MIYCLRAHFNGYRCTDTSPVIALDPTQVVPALLQAYLQSLINLSCYSLCFNLKSPSTGSVLKLIVSSLWNCFREFWKLWEVRTWEKWVTRRGSLAVTASLWSMWPLNVIASLWFLLHSASWSARMWRTSAVRYAPAVKSWDVLLCPPHHDGLGLNNEPKETAPSVVSMRFKCKYFSKELIWSILPFLHSVLDEVGRKGEMSPWSLYLQTAFSLTLSS